MIKLSKINLNNIIKNIIIETVGVPNNIFETSKQIVKLILEELNNKDYINNSFNFIVYGDFKIGDINFNSFRIFINILYNNSTNKLINSSAEFSNNIEVNENNLTFTRTKFSPETSSLTFNFVYNERNFINKLKIYNYINKNKINFITNVTHELKHFYDGQKKQNGNLINLVKTEVNLAAISNNNIPIINQLLYSLYYTSENENLVRNSELKSLLQQKKVLKSDFKTFIENTDIYKNLIYFRNLTFEKIIVEIKNNYMEQLKMIVQKVNPNLNINEYEENTLINEYFKLVFLTLRHSKVEQFRTYIPNITDENFLEIIKKK